MGGPICACNSPLAAQAGLVGESPVHGRLFAERASVVTFLGRVASDEVNPYRYLLLP